MRKLHKAFATILAIALVIGLLPMAAYADDGEASYDNRIMFRNATSGLAYQNNPTQGNQTTAIDTVIDMKGGMILGTNVILWQKKVVVNVEIANQAYILVPDINEEYFQIKSIYPSNTQIEYVFALTDVTAVSGTEVIITFPNASDDAQWWKLLPQPDGSFTIVSKTNPTLALAPSPVFLPQNNPVYVHLTMQPFDAPNNTWIIEELEGSLPERPIESVSPLAGVTIAVGTPIGEIGLPQSVQVSINGLSPRSLPVVWNMDGFDANVPGTYNLAGSLQLEGMIKNPSNLTASLTVVVESEPSSDDYFAIAAGYYHSLATKADGSLWAWGNNYYGQIGDGSTTYSYSPVKILDDVSAVAAGGYHSLALLDDGTLWAWGHNEHGQLGDGSTNHRYSPVKILDDVSAVAAGHIHSLAIKSDGSLWAWGDNAYYQLGDGTRMQQDSPVKILDNASDIAAGGFHSLALLDGGSLWAWGDNYYGQLGDGSNTHHNTPFKILDDASAIAAGYGHSLAVMLDGSLLAWGYNTYDQIGNGSKTDEATPVKILDNATAAAAGYWHSLALLNDDSLWAWGANYHGQLGDDSITQRSSPVKILNNATDISAGEAHTLAIDSNGDLWAWGWNNYGQLGLGHTNNMHEPQFVMNLYDLDPTDPPTYAVTVANGSGGGQFAEGEEVALTADAAPNGQRFKQWSITPEVEFLDGTDTASHTVKFSMPAQPVAAEAIFEDITFTAFTIAFNANGGTGTMPSVNVESEENNKAPASAFTRANHTFFGWNTQANGAGTMYKVGDTVDEASELITLYAQWTRNALVVGPGPIIVPGW